MGRMSRMLTVVALVAGLATACGSGGSEASGTLRIGTNSTIDSLNPFVAFNQDAYTTFEYIYPYLVQYDTRKVAAGTTDDSAIVGDFATKWETSGDGLTWTFHTIPGAKWSDGKPLTANDAEWTIDTILKFASGATSNSAAYLTHVTGADTPNDNTVVVHYETPVANVLSQLQQMPILPEHVWGKLATEKGRELKTFKNDAPIVSGGPFVLKEFKPKDIALFETNPNFYGTKPQIEGWGLQMFRNDDAMIQAMKNGEVDMLEGGGGTVPPTAIQPLRDAGFVVDVGPGMTVNDFIINSNPKKPEHRELLDPTVREAFAHAIDRDRIVETVWQGTAESQPSLIPPADGVWHNTDLKSETFDIDLANQMLDDAKFKKGSDGIRVADGHPMAYEVITPTDLTGVDRSFSIIQGDFDKIGVKLSQKALDSSAAFDAIGAPNYKYLDFDLAMWDWVPLVDPDFILSVMTCDQYGGWSDSGYCDKGYDDMYAKQGQLLDTAGRKDLIWQMQEKLYNDRPYIILNSQSVIETHTKDWTGFVTTQQSSLNPLSKETLTEVHQA
jgi:peptide/nickel transport system substrate-binding protein